MYSKQTEHGKLLIALFSPLFVVIFEVILRLCTQRFKKIVQPGYSYILLVPLYFGSAVMFWIMQAELENLKFIAVLGIIHGALEDLVSYISCNLEKKTSLFGKFSHSSPR